MLSIRIGEAMQEVMTVHAERIARETKCSRRRSILGGAGLVQTLVFGYLRNRLATCEELAQTAAILGYPVSPQAIDERCTPETAECLRRLVEEAVQKAITADKCVSPLLARFASVSLQDSSIVGLPDALQEQWRGCETWTDYGGKAALKIQTRFDLAGGAVHLRLEQGRDSDHRTPLQTAEIEAGSLHLRDLGYFDLDVFQEMARKKAYFVSRVQDNTALFKPNGERINLAKFLGKDKGNRVDMRIVLGAEHRLRFRLIAVRVPAEIARRRRQTVLEKARKKQYTPSAEKLALCVWNIYVTNAPVKLLSLEEVLVLARMRWQIELIFKLWKSHGGLGATRSANPWRILCETFAKLLGQLIQHWILIQVIWSEPRRSLRKAAGAVRAFAACLAASLNDLRALAMVLDNIARALTRTGRVEKRRKHPSAYQLLTNPVVCGYKTQ
jgi:Transposase DDE domain